MKVLWFTNTPSSLSSELGYKGMGGGWIQALEKAFSDYSNISLGISFFLDKRVAAFESKGVKYYPICNNGKKGRLKKWADRISNNVPLNEDVKSMVAIINEFKPDLIHIHGTEQHFGYILKHIKVPIVISIQGILTVYYLKYFSGVPKITFVKNLKPIDFYKLQSPFFLEKQMKKSADREREILKNCLYIAGRTKWDKDVSKLLAPQSKYFTLNEILREPFYSAKWNKTRDKKLVLHTTTSNSAYKGFEVILQTALLLKQYGLDFEWNVAGLSKDVANVRITEKWQQIQSENVNINLLGSLNSDNLKLQLLKGDIYIQVSHIENSPNSVCEAMLLGMPVIASFCGGTSSLIDDNITGILYQDGDIYSLAGKILELNQNEVFCQQIGNAAYDIAQKRHNPQNVLKEAVYLYEEMLKDR